jgi:hypothetical protein
VRIVGIDDVVGSHALADGLGGFDAPISLPPIIGVAAARLASAVGPRLPVRALDALLAVTSGAPGAAETVGDADCHRVLAPRSDVERAATPSGRSRRPEVDLDPIRVLIASFDTPPERTALTRPTENPTAAEIPLASVEDRVARKCREPVDRQIGHMIRTVG